MIVEIKEYIIYNIDTVKFPTKSKEEDYDYKNPKSYTTYRSIVIMCDWMRISKEHTTRSDAYR